MYKILKTKDFNMMASSVAPPSHKNLDRDIRELSISHLIIASKKPFAPYIAKIETLSDEQTELARLQFLHAVKEVTDVFKTSYYITDEVGRHESMTSLTQQVFKDALQDVSSLQKSSEKAPKSKGKLALLTSAVQFVTEGYLFLEKTGITSELKEQYIKKIDSYDAFGKNLLAYAPDQKFVSSEQIKEKAQASLLQQLSVPVNMDFREISFKKNLLGNRDQLWVLIQSDEKYQKAIEDRIYTPLSSQEAKNIRDFTCKVLKAYDVYQSEGFVNTLYAVGMTLDYQQNLYATKSTVTAERAFEEKENSKKVVAERLNRYNEPYIPPTEKEKSDAIAQLEEDKKFQNEYAISFARYKSQLDDLINFGAVELGAKQQSSMPTLTFKTHESGIVVGHINNSPEKILVYPDPANHEVSNNAVFMCFVDSLDNGIPVLNEALRWTPKSSNFYSFSDMLNEIKDEGMQQHIFKRTFSIKDETALADLGSLVKIKM